MGLVISIGDNSVREVSKRTRFNAERGNETVFTFEGDQNALLTQAAFWAEEGISTSEVYPHEGPIYRMDVILPDISIPKDAWERVSEFAQIDLRNNPKLINAASTADTLNNWVFNIRKAMDAGKKLSEQFTGAIDPAMQSLYELMIRGETSFEVERIVLRRRRTIPMDWEAPRTPTAVPIVYRTSTLVREFGIPGNIQGILPSDPKTAQSGTEWAWKIRVDGSTIVQYERKSEEVMEWVFAAWPTSVYDVI